MPRNKEQRPQSASGSTKEKDFHTSDDGPAPKRSRGLLGSSRSHKNQPSPTATGFSGATANPRDSTDAQSRESRGRPTATPESSELGSPAVGPKKKKGGFLALFGCCGVPDSANGLDTEPPEPNHKLEKIPERPATASRGRATPSEQPSGSKTQLSEKEPIPQQGHMPKSSSKNGKRVSGASTQDQSTVSGDRDNESKQTTLVSHGASNPVISVESPKASSTESEKVAEFVPEKDAEGDITMTDAEPIESKQEQQEQPQQQQQQQQQLPDEAEKDSETEAVEIVPRIPPPPPGPPVPNPPTSDLIESPAEQPRKYLLPPQAPELKGRKCLVLDLDETLVHSSFKMLHQADFTIPVEIEGNYHNVYVIKRPGVDEFMKRVGELYEVVVFTASVAKYGDPLLDQLDVHKVVHHRLFRESCYNHQGNYVKDLSQVGRDLKDTIIIDNSPTSYIFHPQHAVPISSWFSDAHDNELLDLIPVLEDLASPNVRDVSLVLDVTL
ncbi:uncharacterized protein CTHT_0056880 [Thermochaetoides thermophila DSM 1495]|uniref:FCP1 homology domain-containing protein n=1 Tax=Chaetomium thermophilum (strain DSM 1495 / CBS 144.50 / IMI 039719) TaxID=759272 RepID=G0SCE0_CHATD|nr:hypothetical protein CTHT_0056880 [Thermochaetoides thermophila DSM 1495]EGS19066.1 hypothetical protein CTHT_0056880 [Thermochaetoides thermophila DSM 1495]